MSLNSDNRKRAFADVVTVEAWHGDFSLGVSNVDLHADVVFGTARLGGEIDSPVRFRLSVKRAELIVIIPEMEPVSVDPRSVSRDAPNSEGRLVEVFERSTGAQVKAGISGVLAINSGSLGLSGEASGQTNLNASKKIEVISTVTSMVVTQSKSSEGYYRWMIEAHSDALEGRPWDGDKRPRLKLIDQRTDPSKGIPPTVRVEVRCRREDLVISDIQIKNERLWSTVQSRVGFKNKIAAAESYIRDKLSEEGLEVKNIQDIFGMLTLGSTTAQSS